MAETVNYSTVTPVAFCQASLSDIREMLLAGLLNMTELQVSFKKTAIYLKWEEISQNYSLSQPHCY